MALDARDPPPQGGEKFFGRNKSIFRRVLLSGGDLEGGHG